MAGVRVSHSIGDLARDCVGVASNARTELPRVVRRNAERGNELAATFARESAGKHGKLYHRAFSAEPNGPLEWEYGPDAEQPQGGMSFEFGSRNQPPHLDLARSVDVVGPAFGDDVADTAAGWFW